MWHPQLHRNCIFLVAVYRNCTAVRFTAKPHAVYQTAQGSVVYKALNGLAPQYIRDLIQPVQHVRTLRSSSKYLLNVPRSNSVTYGDRGFSMAGPVLWNSLPEPLQKSESIDIFKKKLKTHLFREAFNVWLFHNFYGTFNVLVFKHLWYNECVVPFLVYILTSFNSYCTIFLTMFSALEPSVFRRYIKWSYYYYY